MRAASLLTLLSYTWQVPTGRFFSVAASAAWVPAPTMRQQIRLSAVSADFFLCLDKSMLRFPRRQWRRVLCRGVQPVCLPLFKSLTTFMPTSDAAPQRACRPL